VEEIDLSFGGTGRVGPGTARVARRLKNDAAPRERPHRDPLPGNERARGELLASEPAPSAVQERPLS